MSTVVRTDSSFMPPLFHDRHKYGTSMDARSRTTNKLGQSPAGDFGATKGHKMPHHLLATKIFLSLASQSPHPKCHASSKKTWHTRSHGIGDRTRLYGH